MGWLFHYFSHQHQAILCDGCSSGCRGALAEPLVAVAGSGALSPLERGSSGHCDTGAQSGVFAFQGVREHLKLGLEPGAGAKSSILTLGKQLLLFSLLTLHFKIFLSGDVCRGCPQ